MTNTAGRADFQSLTRIAAGFAAVALLGSACATDTRYHEAALAAVSEADRGRCQAVANREGAVARKLSLRDLSSQDWGFALWGALPIYLFEIRRRNETERQRAYEAALQDCLTPLIEQE